MPVGLQTVKKQHLLHIKIVLRYLQLFDNLGFAGDTFNTAWYIANNHADVNSAYFSKVGDDELSDQMLKFMSDNQVDTRYITTVAGSTIGLYLISLVDGERTFSYWRNKSAATFLGQNVDI